MPTVFKSNIKATTIGHQITHLQLNNKKREYNGNNEQIKINYTDL